MRYYTFKLLLAYALYGVKNVMHLSIAFFMKKIFITLLFVIAIVSIAFAWLSFTQTGKKV